MVIIVITLVSNYGNNNNNFIIITEAAPPNSLITQLPGFSAPFPSKHYSGYVRLFSSTIFYIQPIVKTRVFSTRIYGFSLRKRKI